MATVRHDTGVTGVTPTPAGQVPPDGKGEDGQKAVPVATLQATATGTAAPPDPATHGPRDTRARGPFFPSPGEAPDLRGMQAGSGTARVLTGGAGIGPRGFAGGLSRFPMSSTTSELFLLLGVRRVKPPCLRREILNI